MITCTSLACTLRCLTMFIVHCMFYCRSTTNGLEEIELSKNGIGAGINDSKQVVNDHVLNPSTTVPVSSPEESPATTTNSSKTSLLRENAINNESSVDDQLKRQQRKENILNNSGSSAATFEAESYYENRDSDIASHGSVGNEVTVEVAVELEVHENDQTVYSNNASRESGDVQESTRLSSIEFLPQSETASVTRNRSQLGMFTPLPLAARSCSNDSTNHSGLSGTEAQSLSSTRQNGLVITVPDESVCPCMPSSESCQGDSAMLLGTRQQTRSALHSEEVLKGVERLNKRQNEETFVHLVEQTMQSQEPNNDNDVDRHISS